MLKSSRCNVEMPVCHHAYCTVRAGCIGSETSDCLIPGMSSGIRHGLKIIYNYHSTTTSTLFAGTFSRQGAVFLSCSGVVRTGAHGCVGHGYKVSLERLCREGFHRFYSIDCPALGRCQLAFAVACYDMKTVWINVLTYCYRKEDTLIGKGSRYLMLSMGPVFDGQGPAGCSIDRIRMWMWPKRTTCCSFVYRSRTKLGTSTLSRMPMIIEAIRSPELQGELEASVHGANRNQVYSICQPQHLLHCLPSDKLAVAFSRAFAFVDGTLER